MQPTTIAGTRGFPSAPVERLCNPRILSLIPQRAAGILGRYISLVFLRDEKMGTGQPDLTICIPERPCLDDFNATANIPFGVSVEQVFQAMVDFTDFLQTVDTELVRKRMSRLEDMLMPANFSSMVGEFITSNLPKHCPSIAKNSYHNGHPDLLPAGKYPGNSAQHVGADGIEVKASRYKKGWQGHNPEDVWLMVFVFEGGRPSDAQNAKGMTRFRFLAVYGALLEKTDWQFAGRSQTSRRTITATVLPSGFEKMAENWIYKAPNSEVKP